jgi:Cu/Ag efflux pump CusA
MSLSALSVSRPITVLMFYIGVVLLGVVAFPNLSVDFLPPINIPQRRVDTSCILSCQRNHSLPSYREQGIDSLC